jgi:hypothetical protein
MGPLDVILQHGAGPGIDPHFESFRTPPDIERIPKPGATALLLQFVGGDRAGNCLQGGRARLADADLRTSRHLLAGICEGGDWSAEKDCIHHGWSKHPEGFGHSNPFQTGIATDFSFRLDIKCPDHKLNFVTSS